MTTRGPLRISGFSQMERLSSPRHEPVMTEEVVTMLQVARGGVFVDCTVGLGGHSCALLEAGADRLVSFDRDAEALQVATGVLGNWGKRGELVHADFRTLDATLDALGIVGIDGALADLGMSSAQLAGVGRGFSFQRDEPLDMRMDRSAGLTAAEMLDQVDESELADVIHRFGEDRHARRIARVLVATRNRVPVNTTAQLADVVRQAVPRRGGYQRIDPATRTFQALRIWVNRELDALDAWLLSVCRRLNAGARLAVITFHSLEDRIVKHTFRALEREGDIAIKVLTRRPLRPSPAEVSRNPRARSAKLRVAERLA